MLQLRRKQTIIKEAASTKGAAGGGPPPLWISLMMVCFLRSCNKNELAYNFHAYKSSLKIICISFICMLGFPSLVGRLQALVGRLFIGRLRLVGGEVAR